MMMHLEPRVMEKEKRKVKARSRRRRRMADGGETADGEGRRASQGCGFVSGSGGLGNNGDEDRDPNPNPEQKPPEPEPEFVTRKSQARFFFFRRLFPNREKIKCSLERKCFCFQCLFFLSFSRRRTLKVYLQSTVVNIGGGHGAI